MILPIKVVQLYSTVSKSRKLGNLLDFLVLCFIVTIKAATYFKFDYSKKRSNWKTLLNQHRFFMALNI